MSALIIYMSLHGCTEKAAKMLKEAAWQKVDLFNFRNGKMPDIEKYDTIIIGGSIHLGELQGKIKSFCEVNMEKLLKKRVGLYLCHMSEGEQAIRQFNRSFPYELRQHAVAKGLFGGEFNLEKMTEGERSLIMQQANISKTISRINNSAIKGFGRVIFHLDKS